jgi:hypothetical protein
LGTFFAGAELAEFLVSLEADAGTLLFNGDFRRRKALSRKRKELSWNRRELCRRRREFS